MTLQSPDDICGGAAEVALGKRVGARLLQLLNENVSTVETAGLDNAGGRTLATIWIRGQDDFLQVMHDQANSGSQRRQDSPQVSSIYMPSDAAPAGRSAEWGSP